VNLQIPLTPEILAAVSRLDRYAGQWAAGPPLGVDARSRMEKAARILSVGASCRLAGIRVLDEDVATLLLGREVPLRDAAEVLGYAAAMSEPVTIGGGLLDGDAVCRLHARMMGREEPSPWRTDVLHREAFDAEGRAMGVVFSSLPPRLVAEKTEALLTWLELELRSAEQHPALSIAAFTLGLVAVSPFERGNGRLSRLLLGLLLRRAGYTFLPYASLESEMESMRCDYHAATLASQTHLWTGESNLRPWIDFVLTVLDRHRQRVETKVELEREAHGFPPLQRAIVDTVREHGDADAALLLRATGTNRNTLKDNLRRLVQRGVLEKTGQRRGTRYRLAVGAASRPARVLES
jgi:Fic family protein